MITQHINQAFTTKGLILIVSLSFIFACNGNRGDTKIFQNIKSDKFDNSELVIPDSLMLHFPEIPDEKANESLICRATNAFLNEKTNIEYDFLPTISYSKEYKFDTALNICIFKGTIFSSSDTCQYFVIQSLLELKDRYSEDYLFKKYHSDSTLFLVPDFNSIRCQQYGYETICGLPADYDLIIINSGQKFVLPEKYMFDWELLPMRFRHGYSSGVAISSDRTNAIYWTIAW